MTSQRCCKIYAGQKALFLEKGISKRKINSKKNPASILNRIILNPTISDFLPTQMQMPPKNDWFAPNTLRQLKRKKKKRESSTYSLIEVNHTKASSEAEMRLKYTMKRNKTDFTTKSKRSNLSAIKSEQEHGSVAVLGIYYEFWEHAKQPVLVIELHHGMQKCLMQKKGPGKAFILRLRLQGLLAKGCPVKDCSTICWWRAALTDKQKKSPKCIMIIVHNNNRYQTAKLSTQVIKNCSGIVFLEPSEMISQKTAASCGQKESLE